MCDRERERQEKHNFQNGKNCEKKTKVPEMEVKKKKKSRFLFFLKKIFDSANLWVAARAWLASMSLVKSSSPKFMILIEIFWSQDEAQI